LPDVRRAGSDLYLIDPPADRSRHYPSGYYSFAASPPRLGPVHRRLRRWRTALLLSRAGRLDSLLFRRERARWVPWLAGRRVGLDSRICDIGSGSGKLLHRLRLAGFTDVTGVDPYVDAPSDEPGLRILKQRPDEVTETFDVVILSHALEHMSDPAGVMQSVRRMVRPGGTVVVRLPLADSEAWDRYGTNWVQLDAPRHLFVPTSAAVRRLLDRVGFTIERTIYDSDAFQFWGSEQYAAGVPLRHPLSFADDPGASAFEPAQIAAFESEARALNRIGRGDSATFVLSPL
jgi:SAM-dependent methyltransferase